MEMTIFVMGYVLMGSAAVSVTAAAVVWAATTVMALRERRDQVAREAERGMMTKDLLESAWWFTEDEATQRLVCDLATHIIRCGTVYGNIDGIRDRWRACRALTSAGR